MKATARKRRQAPGNVGVMTDMFRPWTSPTAADRALGAALNGDDGPLRRYLESGQEVPLNLGLYLSERLWPARHAPRKSRLNQYRTLARKPIDVAAVFANEILRRQKDNGEVRVIRLSQAHKRAAAKKAIQRLAKRFPSRFLRLGGDRDVDRVIDRMKRTRDYDFRRIFTLLIAPK